MKQKKKVHAIGVNRKFKVPGDAGFPFAAFFEKPANNTDKQLFVDYFGQIRHETLLRLVDLIYNTDGTPNKHWFQFSKQKWMGASNM